MSDIEKDDFTEIVDARIGRVDLVGGAANGHRFLLAKSEAGMIPADMVRDLIEKANAAADEGTADVADEVEKADLEVGDLIEDGGTTADSAPGSADWEEKDGGTAMNALNVLTRVKEVLGWLAGREQQELAAGDFEAGDNAWDLMDAGYAIDCAIDLIAPYAVGEQIDAELSEEAEGVLKAVAELNPRSLAIVESSSAIVKSGRVLSAANESALRDAASSIEKVLASLPAAPEASPEAAAVAEVTKDEAEPVEVEKAEDEAEPVEKADDAPEAGDDDSSLVLVYDDKGNIIGAVDPAEITTFAATPSGQKAEEPPDNKAAEPVGAEPTSADLKPAPAAAAGVGDEAAPAAAPVEKGTEEPAAEMSVDELLKGLEGVEDPQVTALVKALKESQEQVELLKSLPAAPKATANGVPMPVLRGQDQGATVDPESVETLRKQASDQNVEKRESARAELDKLAAAKFDEIRRNGAPIGQM